MKNYKTTVYLFLCACLLNIIGILAYVKIVNLNNELIETKDTIETLQETIDIQSVNYDTYQKNVEAQILEIQEEYNNVYNELQELQLLFETQINEESVSTNRWGITLTDNEIDLLARIVMLEAGGECALGKEAVVEVIFNRMYDESFPNTLEGVLSAPRQFTTWENRNITAATPTEEVYESINNVLSGQTHILPFETVYFSRGGEPGKKEQITIDNHVFCNK